MNVGSIGKLLGVIALAVSLCGLVSPSDVRADSDSVDAAKASAIKLGNLENAVNRLVREYKNPVALTRQFPMQRRLIDARVFFELENYEPASILLYELVERPEFKKNPEYSNALVLLGRCLRQLNNPLGARKYLRAGMLAASIKTREEALYHLIDLALSERDLESLRELVGTIGSPGSVKTRYALAKAVFLLKDYKRTISLLKLIPSSDPVYSLSRYYLGASQTALKKYKEAIKTFTRISAIKPKGPDGVSFANVKDGDTIANGFELEFLVSGKNVAPAGEPIDDKTIGHHHLIIDAKGIEPGTPVPADASHIHFGKGQTKHILNVAPGQHTLTLQFADGAHRSYGPEWAKTITVTVTESKK